jgi:hypothetical protein
MMKSILSAALLSLAACATTNGAKVETKAATADAACADHTGVQSAAPAAVAGTKAFDHRPNVGEVAICPVSGETFVVGADAKIIEHGGKWYAVCCDDCAPEFEKDPAKFAAQ